MEGVLRCVLTCLLGMSAVVMMDTHWMEMECLAMVSACIPGMCGSVKAQPSMVIVTIHTRSSFEYVCGYCCDKTVRGECMNTRSGGSRGGASAPGLYAVCTALSAACAATKSLFTSGLLHHCLEPAEQMLSSSHSSCVSSGYQVLSRSGTGRGESTSLAMDN